MTAPSLTQVFGANAAQTTTTLTISKQDLASVGLTASATNTADSLLAAIVLLAQSSLNQTNQQSNPDQNVYVDDGYDSLLVRNSSTYRRKTKNIYFDQIDTSSTFNPNNY